MPTLQRDMVDPSGRVARDRRDLAFDPHHACALGMTAQQRGVQAGVEMIGPGEAAGQVGAAGIGAKRPAIAACAPGLWPQSEAGFAAPPPRSQ